LALECRDQLGDPLPDRLCRRLSVDPLRGHPPK
jgi:hypothetical protein